VRNFGCGLFQTLFTWKSWVKRQNCRIVYSVKFTLRHSGASVSKYEAYLVTRQLYWWYYTSASCCIDIPHLLISISNATQNRSQYLLYFKIPLKSHWIATSFGLIRPSSGNCAPIGTVALHQFARQCVPCCCISSFALKRVWEWTISLRSALFSFCCVHVVPPSCVVLIVVLFGRSVR
jgi:hypothetical protein